MKKLTVCCILPILCASLLLAGCGAKGDTALQSPAPTVTASPTPTPTPVSTSRPIAVMIDNDNEDARPQAGLQDAYLIYEMYVEGSATRMMALFKDAETEKIGPVRSSRHYFLDYALEHDAIYVHYGWSPKAAQDIAALKVNNINGVSGGDGQIFWRERKFQGDWHSAYTSIQKITDYAANQKGYSLSSQAEPLLKQNKTDTALKNGSTAQSITLPYAGFYRVSYTYDPQAKEYSRCINGQPHAMQDGSPLTAKNIFILQIQNFAISGDDKNRQDMKTVGSGSGYYCTDGKMIPITWEKESRAGRSVYKDEQGQPVTINPGGQTWVQIVPPSMELTIA